MGKDLICAALISVNIGGLAFSLHRTGKSPLQLRVKRCKGVEDRLLARYLS